MAELLFTWKKKWWYIQNTENMDSYFSVPKDILQFNAN